MVWIYLIIASFCEVFWASSLKFLDFRKIKTSWRHFGVVSKVFWYSLIPLGAYVFFGISNVSLLSIASKLVPLTIVYAVWMGLAMCIQTIIDLFFFKEKINKKQLSFLILIIIGVVGVRLFQKTHN